MKKKEQKWFDSAIIKEDGSKTTSNSKHFVLNNGTRKAVFAANDINYFDKKEKAWKPIDNTLKATEDGYVAGFGKYTAKLSKSNDNEAVEISDGTDIIRWEYLGINKGAKRKLEKRRSRLNVKNETKDTMSLMKASRAVYADAEGNIDLDYIIESNGVKENITVKEKSDSYKYYFLLHVAGFEMKTAEDGVGIEFYKAVSNPEDEKESTPEFIMPSPFMYDANGSRSEGVKYELEKTDDGNYIFSVEADAEWINAEERVFPVSIDPQLLTVGESYITVTHDMYYWNECCDGSCFGSEWTHIANPYYSYIYLRDNGLYKTTASICIKKSEIDLVRSKLISAKLVFQKYSGESYSSSVRLKIGNGYYTHNNGSSVTANITDLYNSADGDFTVELSMASQGNARKFYVPTLQLEYQALADERPIRKTLSVEKGVSAEFDVVSGNATVMIEDISDPVLGVTVSHVYKPGDSLVEYGQNFRLNLDERLEKTSTSPTGDQYTYTDERGDVHTFDERFYYIGKNGGKIYITGKKDTITADADGRLWYGLHEAFRELTTTDGLRASSRFEGVNDAEWVEQRVDEEKQTEEQIRSYENTLCNFVTVDKSTGAKTSSVTESMLSSPDSIESILDESCCASDLLLSKEEALSYKSLLTQKESNEISKEALNIQLGTIKDSADNLKNQIKTQDDIFYQEKSNEIQLILLGHEKESYETRLDEEEIAFFGDSDDTLADGTRYGLQKYINAKQLEDIEKQNTYINTQIANFHTSGMTTETSGNGMLTRQRKNVRQQHELEMKRTGEIQAQINMYVEKSEKYIEQFRSYYKEYLSLKNQLKVLKAQVPVAYLISDSAVKGFNENGDLVIIQDKYGKYVVIEREEYTNYGKTRISSVYDDKEHQISFAYNGNKKLSEICTSLGERTSFRYDDSGALVGIERSGQPSLTLKYTTVSGIKQISSVVSSDKTSATLSYSLTGALKGITQKTTVAELSHDNVTEASTSQVSALLIEYTETDTTLKYDGIKQEIYKVNPNTEHVTAHYEIVNGLVTGAERYTYSNGLLIKTARAGAKCLNRYPYANFDANMQIETVEEVTYNSFKEPVEVKSMKYSIPRTANDYPIEETVTERVYNDDRKLTEVKTTHYYCDCCEAYDTTVAVEKYFYNPAGELVRKESYVEGEELKTGINIEEHVFNDKGIEIQSFSYNSLDPSSKLYTENEVDEQGRTLASFDESGEHKTTFDYERDGVTVKTERLPNGSKFSYGRDTAGNATAITHSTENGEENSTTQLRTLDVVTEVKSGNNRVRYKYDKKRRVKSISLNGVDNYVSYTYTGDNTNAEKVSATMANGTTATTTKNAYGNVTKSTVGSKTVTNTYDTDQQLTKIVDSVSGTTTLAYDDKGNLTTVTAPDHSESYTYNDKDILTSKTIDGKTYSFTYKATSDKSLDIIFVAGSTVRPQTDALGRNTGKTIDVGVNKIAEEKISYVKFGDHATNMPSTVRFAENGVFNESIQYRYDSMGNIIEVFENGRSACRYEYDALGRLTREDNVAFAKTTTWAYDNNGNILARYEYAITTKPTAELHLLDCTYVPYTYDDNSDKLMSYNGEEFVYDTIGNPIIYRGKNVTWSYGRELISFDGNNFSYDARGRRIAKNGITFTYDSNGNLIKQSNGLEFFYDHTGVFAVKYNGSTYFYRKNAQNDIIALLDNTGATVVKYKYDAWGKCVVDASTTNTELANLNPFRYRSYYLDTETGFYFLKTRYYDPEIGRFMTIDDISYLDPESINGLNLYAYCGSNPVMRVDTTGCSWFSWLTSGLSLALGIALCFVPGGQAIGVSMIVGGSLGLIANAVSPAISQAIGGASSMANGLGAISTGFSLLSFGVPGIIAGIGMMLLGGVTMAFGANEIVSAVSGTNYIQEWTGMSDSAYGWTYLGLNVASSVGTSLGRWGMRIAATTNLRSSPSTAKPYGKNVWKNNEYYYNGRGKPYWSRHNLNMINDGTPNGFHLHVGFGRDGEHIYNYVDLIMKLILRGKFNI